MKYAIYLFHAFKARYSTPLFIDTRDNFVSYYWVVVFANGIKIPYPICNQEGCEASPFENGSVYRSWLSKTIIRVQELMLKRHFEKVQSLAEPLF
jgi:hypothetical protein